MWEWNECKVEKCVWPSSFLPEINLYSAKSRSYEISAHGAHVCIHECHWQSCDSSQMCKQFVELNAKMELRMVLAPFVSMPMHRSNTIMKMRWKVLLVNRMASMQFFAFLPLPFALFLCSRERQCHLIPSVGQIAHFELKVNYWRLCSIC